MSTIVLPRATPSEQAVLTERGYKLIKKLGEGSYGQVYLTEYSPHGQPEKQTRLACKIIDTSKAPKDFVRKFLPRELDIIVKLNHPHLVHVHSVFQRRAKYYVFMRCAEKGDLLDFILANGPLAEQQCRIWMKQIALAIEYLHILEIVHRDIKCENVLITGNNNVKLADFGFARYIVDAQGKPLLAETYCGSLAYAAPEIVKGTPYNPKKADIWSLGVVLFVMLNKTMPFDNDNMRKLYELQTSRHYRFRPKVLQNISDNVRVLVSWMLEPEVVGRCSIEQVIKSEWFATDPRGNQLTQQEEEARNAAIDEIKARQFNKRELAGTTKKKARLAVPFKKRKEKQGDEAESVAPGVKVLKEGASKSGQFKSVIQPLEDK